MAAKTKTQPQAIARRTLLQRLFGGGEEDPSNRRSRWQSLGVVLSVSLITVTIGWFGLRQVWSYVVNMDEFRVYPGRIEFGKVAWLDGDAFRKDLLGRDSDGFLRRGYSILEEDLAVRVARAYEQSPWVRRVESVRKEFPNKLRIEIELRRPYAAVRVGGRAFLVDREGVVLNPEIYRLPANGLGRPMVNLNYIAAEPQPGVDWGKRDGGVALALDMLRYMDSKPELFHDLGVCAIRVERDGIVPAGGTPWVVLQTRVATDIRWGGSPYAWAAGASAEVAPGVKLRRLAGILNENLERLALFEWIDVRWDRPSVKKRGSTAA